MVASPSDAHSSFWSSMRRGVKPGTSISATRVRPDAEKRTRTSSSGRGSMPASRRRWTTTGVSGHPATSGEVTVSAELPVGSRIERAEDVALRLESFAKEYVPNSQATLEAFGNLATALADIRTGVEQTADAYEGSDQGNATGISRTY